MYESFARQHGFEDCGYFSFAESGYLTDGQRHKRIRALVSNNSIDVVWFPDEKRASRNTIGGLQWFRDLAEAGVRVFVGARELTAEPASLIATGVNLTMAEGERMTLQQRAMAQHHYVAQGQWLSNKAPYGYDREDKTRLLSIDLHKAKVVHAIFATAAAQPLAVEKVMAAVRETGLSRHQVRTIIANPIYKGQIRWGQRLHPFPAYRMVTDEIWQGAQAPVLERPKRTIRAIDRLAFEMGNVVLVDELLRRIPTPCLQCPPPNECGECRGLANRPRRNGGRPPAEEPHRLRLVGTVKVGGYEIPKVGCRHGHEVQVVGTRKMAAARQVLRCRRCDNRDPDLFWIRPINGSSRFQVQCKACRTSQGEWHFHPLRGILVHEGKAETPPLDRFNEVR